MFFFSGPPHQAPTHGRNPSPQQQQGRHDDPGTAEQLDAQPIVPTAQDGSGHGGAHEQAKGADEETLTHPRTDLAHVGRQSDDGDRGHGHKPPREEAVEQDEDDDATEVADADPDQGQYARHHRARDQHVEGSHVVGEEVGYDSTRDAGGVEHGKKIKAQVFVDDAVLDGVVLDVVDGTIESQEPEKHGGAEQHVWEFGEGGQVDQVTFLLGHHSRPHDQDREPDGHKRDEPQDARGPAEPNLLFQPAKHDGVDDTAEARTRRGQAVGQGFLGRKVLRQNGDRGDEEAAVADADAKGLGEHGLPVLLTQGGHHKAKRDEDRTRGDEGAKVARVIRRAGDDADEQEEKRLDRADP